MQFQGNNSYVRLVVYSPDGRKIDSASDDKTVRIWDAERGVQIGRQLHPYMVDDSNDSSGCVDDLIHIWQVIPVILAILATPTTSVMVR